MADYLSAEGFEDVFVLSLWELSRFFWSFRSAAGHTPQWEKEIDAHCNTTNILLTPQLHTSALHNTHTCSWCVFFFLSQSCNQKQSSTITSHLPPLSPSLYPLLLLFSLPLGCLTHSLSSTLNWITSPSTRSTDSFLYTPALSGCSAGVFEILARCGGTAQGLLPSTYKGKPPGPLDCIPVCCQVPKWKWLKLPCEAAAFRYQVSSRVVPGQI